MKFAKELEDDLVPEWRVKYFNYKIGKKKIKAVARALRNANRVSPAPVQQPYALQSPSGHIPFTHYDFNKRDERTNAHSPERARTVHSHLHSAPPRMSKSSPSHKQTTPSPRNPPTVARRQSITKFAQSPPVIVPGRSDEDEEEDDDVGQIAEHDDEESSDSTLENDDERTRLNKSLHGKDFHGRPRYGSIVGSPPKGPSTDFRLPDPALDLDRTRPPATRENSAPLPDVNKPALHNTPDSVRFESKPHRTTNGLRKRMLRLKHQRTTHLAGALKTFTSLPLDSPGQSDAQTEAYRELDSKQDDFFNFLDKELDKVERFYRSKEEEANSRLEVLRGQLHEMRDRRINDLQIAKNGGKIADKGLIDGQIPIMSTPFTQQLGTNDHQNKHHRKSLFNSVGGVLSQNGKIGKTSQAMQQLSSPQGPQPKDINQSNDRGDYVRREQPHERVPYRFAKRRLKLALQEFYRGLELLKSYTLLNRTAFRKINKKYDKAVMARPPLRYMNEKVNNAYFVQSTVIEGHLVAIEDLYARYFERGNRKVAVNKLRSHLRGGDQSGVAFRNGLYLAAGTGFAIAGIVNGAPLLFSDDATIKAQTSYLFQIYGGYFLTVLLFLFFILDCRIWTRYKINYIFVFEFDTRHVLDWRQLAELPCFFLMLNGIFLWISFQISYKNAMHLYWPIVLVACTLITIFFPFRTLYYRSRKWWIYSNWRLLLAGLYPVEFRDFYLGDMYCSETYAMSQIELFFCLYAHGWNDPAQCNSNHSMLLGFFTTLPAVWRALQCLRRYYDSRNWFPHLANFAKYLCNVIYYMTLSLYRLQLSSDRKAAFIFFAALNGVYCSFWDVFMDFSLGNPWSKNFMLRDHLAFRRKSFYYAAVLIDVVFRQQWILYAIFSEDLQHSAAMSFFVGLAEVIRRGMWSLFRVENEHCNNVEKFRAHRDVPLPYSLASSPKEPVAQDAKIGTDTETDTRSPATKSRKNVQLPPADGDATGSTTGVDLERAQTNQTTSSQLSLRRRKALTPGTPGMSALQRVGTAIAAAHAQDFEKRRRPEVVGRNPQDRDAVLNRPESSIRVDQDDDDDDDDEDAAEDNATEHARLREERYLERQTSSPNYNHNIFSNSNGHVATDDSPAPASMSGARAYQPDEIDGVDPHDSVTERPSTSRIERVRQHDRASDQNEADVSEARDRLDRAGTMRD